MTKVRFLLPICALAAAYGQSPPADPAAPRTVRYQGVVIDAASGEPIAGATVGGTTTDTAGRFLLQYPLPPISSGSPSEGIRASKPGYFQPFVDPNSGELVRDRAGNLLYRQIILRLAALAAASGTVLDAGGRPVAQARIDFVPLAGQAQSKREAAGPNGQFQVQVTPGTYFVCSYPAETTNKPWTMPDLSSRVVADPACYPSAEDFASATPVTFRAGEIPGPLTIRLRQAKTYTIRGKITSLVPKTRVWGQRIEAIEGQPPDSGRLDERAAAFSCVDRQGRFLIEGLPEGRYAVQALAGADISGDDCELPKQPPVVVIGDDCAPRRLAAVYYGTLPLTVNRDMTGLAIEVGRGATATGRLVVEGEDVSSVPRQYLQLTGAEGRSIQVGDDGRFQLADLPPDTYRVSLTEGPLYVSQVRQDGHASPDGRISIEPGSTKELEVTARKASAMLKINPVREAGDAGDKPLAVVIVPDGPRRDQPQPCFRPTAQEFVRGPFRPGHYLVVAAYCEGNLPAPAQAWLEGRKDSAVRVELRDGETETVSVKVQRFE